jgi:glycosyltransferase involved in cell wall biosynthesis
MFEQVTPLVVTYNEEANIGRLLESLSWAKRIVVVDSESTDATRSIANDFGNVTFVVRQFDELARQWNFGLNESGIDTEWVLALDADYVLPKEFVDELESLRPAVETTGYRAKFDYCIEGVPLHGGLYPPVTVLFRRQGACFLQDGHAHRVSLSGAVQEMRTRLRHDDRKPIERWFWSQLKYMRLEAAKLRTTPTAELRLPDRIRKLIVIAPWLVFFYCLFVKGNILDGRRGLMYATQRATAEAILALYLLCDQLTIERHE